MPVLRVFLVVVSESSRYVDGEMFKRQPAAVEPTALSESGIHLNRYECISQIQCMHI